MTIETNRHTDTRDYLASYVEENTGKKESIQFVKEIFQHIQMMDGTKSNLLNLKAPLIRILNTGLFQGVNLKQKCCLAIKQFIDTSCSFVKPSFENKADEINKERIENLILLYKNFKDIPEIREILKENFAPFACREGIVELLEILTLLPNDSSEIGFEILNSIPIVKLSFYGQLVTDQVLDSLKKLRHLEKLNLTSSHLLTSESLSKLPSTIRCLNLSGLALLDCDTSPYQALANLKHLNQLEYLGLYRIDDIPEEMLAELPTSIKEINRTNAWWGWT